MEASALFTAGAFLGVDTAAVLVVSDELSGLSWKPGFKEPGFAAARSAVAAALTRWMEGPARPVP
jgi:hypothetical protein